MVMVSRPHEGQHYTISSRHGCNTLAALFSSKPLKPLELLNFWERWVLRWRESVRSHQTGDRGPLELSLVCPDSGVSKWAYSLGPAVAPGPGTSDLVGIKGLSCGFGERRDGVERCV